MGDIFTGSSKTENIQLLTPQQRSFLSSVLGGVDKQAGSAYNQLLQGPNQQNLQSVFQQAYVNPATEAFQKNIIPAIQQRFVDMDAGSSGALNRALADAASGLATQLGGEYGNLYQSALTHQLGALSGLSGLAGQQTFSPIVHQKQGILGPLLGAAGQLGAAGLIASSKEVKEEVEPYNNDDTILDEMDVYSYRYKGKDETRIGFIAEMMPSEVVIPNDEGILSVDMYGVMALLTNAMKSMRRDMYGMRKYIHSMEAWLQNNTEYDESLLDEYDPEFPVDFDEED